jgi:hypothetical protein
MLVGSPVNASASNRGQFSQSSCQSSFSHDKNVIIDRHARALPFVLVVPK